MSGASSGGVGRTALLRFDGGVRRDPAVERWLAAQPGERGALARTWFSCIRACGADVVELMHDGCPTACVQDAAFAYVNVFREHVNVGFFRGTDLPDPARLLQGTGKRMRHVKLRPGQSIHEPALQALIAAAHADIVARLQES